MAEVSEQLDVLRVVFSEAGLSDVLGEAQKWVEENPLITVFDIVGVMMNDSIWYLTIYYIQM